MPRCLFFYWGCLTLTLLGHICAFYLPRSRTPPATMHTGTAMEPRLIRRSRSHDSAPRSWTKRMDYHSSFVDSVKQHASQFDEKQMSFEKLFELFDLNEDGCIDRFEFEFILDILVIF